MLTDTAKRSAMIRVALKAKGISTRDVSVHTHNYAGGSSIRIRIKNPAVDVAVVKAAAITHESVRWDDFSGEILSGGNRFVVITNAEGYIV